MTKRWAIGAGLAMLAAFATGGCAAISENRGYVFDNTLASGIQPGVDNRRSVEATLGQPSFTSEYGDLTWYYVANTTQRRPFRPARISDSRVLAINFDAAGNVASIDDAGVDQVVYLSPDGARTPTLGRERGFLEDLFGNIGQVGSGPVAGGGTPN